MELQASQLIHTKASMKHAKSKAVNFTLTHFHKLLDALEFKMHCKVDQLLLQLMLEDGPITLQECSIIVERVSTMPFYWSVF